MKHLFSVLGALLVATTMMAQATAQVNTDNESVNTMGSILDSVCSHTIHDTIPLVSFTQDPRIMKLVNRKYSTQVLTSRVGPTRGYRVQVFSSNNPRQGRALAAQMRQRVCSTFPTQNVYMVYMAPFWKVRLGDCHNRAAAVKLADEVKRAYPGLRGEIYVVPDNIH